LDYGGINMLCLLCYSTNGPNHGTTHTKLLAVAVLPSACSFHAQVVFYQTRKFVFHMTYKLYVMFMNMFFKLNNLLVPLIMSC